MHALLFEIPKDIRKKRIEEVLALVNLEKRANDLIRTYSGGMRRRLELARGMMHHPSVLFLDEPTLALTRKRGSISGNTSRNLQQARI